MLTDDMSALRSCIVAMRQTRGAMMNQLDQGNEDRKRAVSELCLQHRGARTGMARRTKSERIAALRNLKRTVDGCRLALRTDLAGVRKAWVLRSA